MLVPTHLPTPSHRFVFLFLLRSLTGLTAPPELRHAHILYNLMYTCRCYKKINIIHFNSQWSFGVSCRAEVVIKVILNSQASVQPACSHIQLSCPLLIFDKAMYPRVKPATLTLPILVEHLLQGTLHQGWPSTRGVTGLLSHLSLTTQCWGWMGVSPGAQVNHCEPFLPCCCYSCQPTSWPGWSWQLPGTDAKLD